MTQAEREVLEGIAPVLEPWIAAESDRVKQEVLHDEFVRFHGWATDCGLMLPVNGRIVAAYLVELAVDGASLPELIQAANCIHYYYDAAQVFLDPTPITAAFALITAQTRLDRTLH